MAVNQTSVVQPVDSHYTGLTIQTHTQNRPCSVSILTQMLYLMYK